MNRRALARFRSPASRHPALLATVILALTGQACGGADDHQEAIQKASVTLNGLGVSGSVMLPGIGDRRTQYQGVIASLKPVADSGTGARAAAANMLIARSHAGLAEIAAQDAAAAEGRWLSGLAAIRGTYDKALSQQAVADALSSFDPTTELAAIDAQIRERERAAVAAIQAKDRQIEVLHAIKARAEEARGRVAAERTREAEVRARAQGATQTAKAVVFEEAREVRRRGDELEKQAAGFDAEAAKESPEIASLEAEVNKLNTQIEMLRQAKAALGTRAEQSRAQSAMAAKEASDTRDQVAQMVQGLTKLRDDTTALSEEAVKAYKAGIAAAGKTSGGGGGAREAKAATAVVRGNLQQALGDVLTSRTRGLRDHLLLLEALAQGRQASIGPEQITNARNEYERVRTEAQQAYTDATASFGSAGATGDLKARLDSLSERLGRLGGSPDAPAAPGEGDPAPEPAPDADEPGTDAPAEPPADPAPVSPPPPGGVG